MTDQAPTPQALRKALQAPDLRPLFTEELGWDNPQGGPLSEEADGQTFTFTPVARKVNFVVYRASPTQDGRLPGKDTIRKLERKLDAKAAERLVVYSNASGDQALWARHKKEQGKAPSLYTVEYKRSLRNAALVHYLKSLYVSLDEDLGGLTTIDVARKASTIEVERLTRQFYRDFAEVREVFVGEISGVTGKDREHYAGLMLNRLMFVYFIQKKNYLADDPDYLRNRLKQVQAKKGTGQFQSFYRAFLRRLFHEGLGATPHDPELVALIGRVPYLNGGLFEEHRIELENREIEIPDKAFEKVLDFFEGWRWTIDESVKAETDVSGKPEISPDVLGYIFERYVNERAKMGAYYTKEDITEYISKNAILSFVLERVREDCRVAFEGERTIWDLLKDNPDHYIHAAVRKGTEYELPEHIREGLDPNQPDLLEKRSMWNRKADEEYALPTEIWREVIVRRNHYFDVRGKLERGEVRTVSDLITLNLDIITFVQDVIRYAEGPELIRVIWKAITRMTVLDPTCGSGAFLLAAAGILAPLYHLCLERMAELVDALSEDERKLPDFREVLLEQTQHDRQYYVLKQIIIRNLYGVDIMAEAVEIAKLRLFLKLMAYSQKDDRKPNLGLEPLPDIDFNVRAGNTLVGYSTREEAESAVQSQILHTSGITWEQIKEKAGNIDRLEALFRDQQLKQGEQITSTEKQELRARLSELEALLNGYLAADYGIDEKRKPGSFAEWHDSHQPFHWFIEFHNVMGRGGFDCIVGNPPYAEVPKDIARDYLKDHYRTALDNWSRDEDVYTFVYEKSTRLVNRSGSIGFIMPISLSSSTKRTYESLRKFISKQSSTIWLSHFDRIPSSLFGNDVRTRCTILIGLASENNSLYTTELKRWSEEYRAYLLYNVTYSVLEMEISGGIPKVASNTQAEVLNYLLRAKKPLKNNLADNITYTELQSACPNFPDKAVFIGGTAYNWLPAWREIPSTQDAYGNPSLPARTLGFKFKSDSEADIIFALLCSSMGYWWWAVMSDGFNLKKWLIEKFPLSLQLIPDDKKDGLSYLGKKLRIALANHYVFKDNVGRVGNFYLPGCEDIILEIDHYLYEAIEIISEDFVNDIREFNARFSRSAR